MLNQSEEQLKNTTSEVNTLASDTTNSKQISSANTVSENNSTLANQQQTQPPVSGDDPQTPKEKTIDFIKYFINNSAKGTKPQLADYDIIKKQGYNIYFAKDINEFYNSTYGKELLNSGVPKEKINEIYNFGSKLYNAYSLGPVKGYNPMDNSLGALPENVASERYRLSGGQIDAPVLSANTFNVDGLYSSPGTIHGWNGEPIQIVHPSDIFNNMDNPVIKDYYGKWTTKNEGYGINNFPRYIKYSINYGDVTKGEPELFYQEEDSREDKTIEKNLVSRYSIPYSKDWSTATFGSVHNAMSSMGSDLLGMYNLFGKWTVGHLVDYNYGGEANRWFVNAKTNKYQSVEEQNGTFYNWKTVTSGLVDGITQLAVQMASSYGIGYAARAIGASTINASNISQKGTLGLLSLYATGANVQRAKEAGIHDDGTVAGLSAFFFLTTYLTESLGPNYFVGAFGRTFNNEMKQATSELFKKEYSNIAKQMIKDTGSSSFVGKSFSQISYYGNKFSNAITNGITSLQNKRGVIGRTTTMGIGFAEEGGQAGIENFGIGVIMNAHDIIKKQYAHNIIDSHNGTTIEYKNGKYYKIDKNGSITEISKETVNEWNDDEKYANEVIYNKRGVFNEKIGFGVDDMMIEGMSAGLAAMFLPYGTGRKLNKNRIQKMAVRAANDKTGKMYNDVMSQFDDYANTTDAFGSRRMTKDGDVITDIKNQRSEAQDNMDLAKQEFDIWYNIAKESGLADEEFVDNIVGDEIGVQKALEHYKTILETKSKIEAIQNNSTLSQEEKIKQLNEANEELKIQQDNYNYYARPKGKTDANGNFIPNKRPDGSLEASQYYSDQQIAKQTAIYTINKKIDQEIENNKPKLKQLKETNRKEYERQINKLRAKILPSINVNLNPKGNEINEAFKDIKKEFDIAIEKRTKDNNIVNTLNSEAEIVLSEIDNILPGIDSDIAKMNEISNKIESIGETTNEEDVAELNKLQSELKIISDRYNSSRQDVISKLQGVYETLSPVGANSRILDKFNAISSNIEINHGGSNVGQLSEYKEKNISEIKFESFLKSLIGEDAFVYLQQYIDAKRKNEEEAKANNTNPEKIDIPDSTRLQQILMDVALALKINPNGVNSISGLLGLYNDVLYPMLDEHFKNKFGEITEDETSEIEKLSENYEKDIIDLSKDAGIEVLNRDYQRFFTKLLDYDAKIKILRLLHQSKTISGIMNLSQDVEDKIESAIKEIVTKLQNAGFTTDDNGFSGDLLKALNEEYNKVEGGTSATVARRKKINDVLLDVSEILMNTEQEIYDSKEVTTEKLQNLVKEFNKMLKNRKKESSYSTWKDFKGMQYLLTANNNNALRDAVLNNDDSLLIPTNAAGAQMALSAHYSMFRIVNYARRFNAKYSPKQIISAINDVVAEEKSKIEIAAKQKDRYAANLPTYEQIEVIRQSLEAFESESFTVGTLSENDKLKHMTNSTLIRGYGGSGKTSTIAPYTIKAIAKLKGKKVEDLKVLIVSLNNDVIQEPARALADVGITSVGYRYNQLVTKSDSGEAIIAKESMDYFDIIICDEIGVLDDTLLTGLKQKFYENNATSFKMFIGDENQIANPSSGKIADMFAIAERTMPLKEVHRSDILQIQKLAEKYRAENTIAESIPGVHAQTIVNYTNGVKINKNFGVEYVGVSAKYTMIDNFVRELMMLTDSNMLTKSSITLIAYDNNQKESILTHIRNIHGEDVAANAESHIHTVYYDNTSTEDNSVVSGLSFDSVYVYFSETDVSDDNGNVTEFARKAMYTSIKRAKYYVSIFGNPTTNIFVDSVSGQTAVIESDNIELKQNKFLEGYSETEQYLNILSGGTATSTTNTTNTANQTQTTSTISSNVVVSQNTIEHSKYAKMIKKIFVKSQKESTETANGMKLHEIRNNAIHAVLREYAKQSKKISRENKRNDSTPRRERIINAVVDNINSIFLSKYIADSSFNGDEESFIKWAINSFYQSNVEVLVDDPATIASPVIQSNGVDVSVPFMTIRHVLKNSDGSSTIVVDITDVTLLKTEDSAKMNGPEWKTKIATFVSELLAKEFDYNGSKHNIIINEINSIVLSEQTLDESNISKFSIKDIVPTITQNVQSNIDTLIDIEPQMKTRFRSVLGIEVGGIYQMDNKTYEVIDIYEIGKNTGNYIIETDNGIFEIDKFSAITRIARKEPVPLFASEAVEFASKYEATGEIQLNGTSSAFFTIDEAQTTKDFFSKDSKHVSDRIALVEFVKNNAGRIKIIKRVIDNSTTASPTLVVDLTGKITKTLKSKYVIVNEIDLSDNNTKELFDEFVKNNNITLNQNSSIISFDFLPEVDFSHTNVFSESFASKTENTTKIAIIENILANDYTINQIENELYKINAFGGDKYQRELILYNAARLYTLRQLLSKGNMSITASPSMTNIVSVDRNQRVSLADALFNFESKGFNIDGQGKIESIVDKDTGIRQYVITLKAGKDTVWSKLSDKIKLNVRGRFINVNDINKYIDALNRAKKKSYEVFEDLLSSDDTDLSDALRFFDWNRTIIEELLNDRIRYNSNLSNYIFKTRNGKYINLIGDTVDEKLSNAVLAFDEIKNNITSAGYGDLAFPLSPDKSISEQVGNIYTDTIDIHLPQVPNTIEGSVSSNTTTEHADTDNSYDPTAFRTSTSIELIDIDNTVKNDVNSEIINILGEEFIRQNNDLFNSDLGRTDDGLIILGQVNNARISLTNISGQTSANIVKVARHEAMHIITLYCLNDGARRKLYKEVAIKYLKNENATDRECNEELSRLFEEKIQYKTTFIGRVIDYLKQLLNKIGLYNFSVSELYKFADKGHFKIRKSESLHNTANEYKNDTYYSTDSDNVELDTETTEGEIFERKQVIDLVTAGKTTTFINTFISPAHLENEVHHFVIPRLLELSFMSKNINHNPNKGNMDDAIKMLVSENAKAVYGRSITIKFNDRTFIYSPTVETISRDMNSLHELYKELSLLSPNQVSKISVSVTINGKEESVNNVVDYETLNRFIARNHSMSAISMLGENGAMDMLKWIIPNLDLRTRETTIKSNDSNPFKTVSGLMEFFLSSIPLMENTSINIGSKIIQYTVPIDSKTGNVIRQFASAGEVKKILIDILNRDRVKYSKDNTLDAMFDELMSESAISRGYRKRVIDSFLIQYGPVLTQRQTVSNSKTLSNTNLVSNNIINAGAYWISQNSNTIIDTLKRKSEDGTISASIETNIKNKADKYIVDFFNQFIPTLSSLSPHIDMRVDILSNGKINVKHTGLNTVSSQFKDKGLSLYNPNAIPKESEYNSFFNKFDVEIAKAGYDKKFILKAKDSNGNWIAIIDNTKNGADRIQIPKNDAIKYIDAMLSELGFDIGHSNVSMILDHFEQKDNHGISVAGNSASRKGLYDYFAEIVAIYKASKEINTYISGREYVKDGKELLNNAKSNAQSEISKVVLDLYLKDKNGRYRFDDIGNVDNVTINHTQAYGPRELLAAFKQFTDGSHATSYTTVTGDRASVLEKSSELSQILVPTTLLKSRLYTIAERYMRMYGVKELKNPYMNFYTDESGKIQERNTLGISNLWANGSIQIYKNPYFFGGIENMYGGVKQQNLNKFERMKYMINNVFYRNIKYNSFHTYHIPIDAHADRSNSMIVPAEFLFNGKDRFNIIDFDKDTSSASIKETNVVYLFDKVIDTYRQYRDISNNKWTNVFNTIKNIISIPANNHFELFNQFESYPIETQSAILNFIASDSGLASTLDYKVINGKLYPGNATTLSAPHSSYSAKFVDEYTKLDNISNVTEKAKAKYELIKQNFSDAYSSFIESLIDSNYLITNEMLSLNSNKEFMNQYYATKKELKTKLKELDIKNIETESNEDTILSENSENTNEEDKIEQSVEALKEEIIGTEVDIDKEILKQETIQLLDSLAEKKKESMRNFNPILWSYFIVHHLANNQLQQITMGSELHGKNDVDWTKRLALENAPKITPITETRFTIPAFARVLYVNDVNATHKFTGDIGKNAATDGLEFTLPCFVKLEHNSYGAKVVGNGQIKPQTVQNNPVTGNTITEKSSKDVVRKFGFLNSIALQNYTKVMLGDYLWNKYQDALFEDYDKAMDNIYKELTTDKKDDLGRDLHAIRKAECVFRISFPTTAKLDILNVTNIQEGFEEEGYAELYANRNNRSVLFDNARTGIQVNTDQNVYETDKALAVQIAYLTGLPETTKNISTDINNLLKEDAERFNDMLERMNQGDAQEVENMIKRIVLNSPRELMNQTKVRDVISSGASITTSRSRVLQQFISTTNKAIKPSMTGGTFAQSCIHDLKVFRKGNSVATSEDISKMYGVKISDTNALQSTALNDGWELSPLRELNYKIDGVEINGDGKAKMEDAITTGKNIETITAEVIMPFSYVSQFGVSKNMTLFEALSFGEINFNGYESKDEILSKLKEIYPLENNTDPQLNEKLLAAWNRFTENNTNKKRHRAIFSTEFEEGKTILDYRETMYNRLADYFYNLNKALDIVAVRIPTSNISSGFRARIVAFTNDNANTIYTSPAKNILDGSDYDIDQLSVYFREISSNGTVVESFDTKVFEAIFKMYGDPSIYQYAMEKIDVSSIRNESIDTVVSGKKNIKVQTAGYFFDMIDNAYKGKNTVGYLATVAAGISKLNHINLATRLELLQFFPRISDPKSYQDFSSNMINTIAKLINLATDNAKELVLGRINISTETTNIVSGMLASGMTEQGMITVLKNPIMSDIMKIIGSKNRFDGYYNTTKKSWEVITSYMKTTTDENVLEFLEEIKNFAYIGEAIKRFNDISNINQNIPVSTSEFKVFKNNVENYFGMPLQKIYDLLEGNTEELPADVQDQLDFINNNRNKNHEESIRSVFPLFDVVKNYPHISTYLKVLYNMDKYLSKASLVDRIMNTPMNDNGDTYSSVIVSKTTGSKRVDKTKAKAIENIVSDFLVAGFLNDRYNSKDTTLTFNGETRMYNLADVNDRSKFFMDFPEYIASIKNNFYFGGFNQELIDNLVVDVSFKEKIKYVGFAQSLALDVNMRKNLLANFKNIEENGNNIAGFNGKEFGKAVRLYQLISYGFRYKKGSMADILDSKMEMEYTSWEKEFEDSGKLQKNFEEYANIMANQGILMYPNMLPKNAKASRKESSLPKNQDKYHSKYMKFNRIVIQSIYENGDVVSLRYSELFNSMSVNPLYSNKALNAYKYSDLTSEEERDLANNKVESINITGKRVVRLNKFVNDYDISEVILKNGVIASVKLNENNTAATITPIVKKTSSKISTKHSASIGVLDTMLSRLNAIFPNIKIVKVTDKTTEGGEDLGYIKKGVVYINTDRATAETPLHEFFGHIAIEVLKNTNFTAYMSLVNEANILIQSDNIIALAIKKEYGNITLEDLQKEIIATFIGIKTSSQLEQQLIDYNNEKVKKDIRGSVFEKFYNAVKNIFTNFANVFKQLIGDNKGILDNVREDITIQGMADLLVKAYKSGARGLNISSSELALLMIAKNGDRVSQKKINSVSDIANVLFEIDGAKSYSNMNAAERKDDNLRKIKSILQEGKNRTYYMESSGVAINLYDDAGKQLKLSDIEKELDMLIKNELDGVDQQIDEIVKILNNENLKNTKLANKYTDAIIQKIKTTVDHSMNTRYMTLLDAKKTMPNMFGNIPSSFDKFNPVIAIEYNKNGEATISVISFTHTSLEKKYNAITGTNSNIFRKYVDDRTAKKQGIDLKNTELGMRKLNMFLLGQAIMNSNNNIKIRQMYVVRATQKNVSGALVFPESVESTVRAMGQNEQFMNQVEDITIKNIFKQNDFKKVDASYEQIISNTYASMISSDYDAVSRILPQDMWGDKFESLPIGEKAKVVRSIMSQLEKELPTVEQRSASTEYKFLYELLKEYKRFDEVKITMNNGDIQKISSHLYPAFEINSEDIQFLQREVNIASRTVVNNMNEFKKGLNAKIDALTKLYSTNLLLRDNSESIYGNLFVRKQAKDSNGNYQTVKVNQIYWTTDVKEDPFNAAEAKRLLSENKITQEHLDLGRYIVDAITKQTIVDFYHYVKEYRDYNVTMEKAEELLFKQTSYFRGFVPVVGKSVEELITNGKIGEAINKKKMQAKDMFSLFQDDLNNVDTGEEVDKIGNRFFNQIGYEGNSDLALKMLGLNYNNGELLISDPAANNAMTTNLEKISNYYMLASMRRIEFDSRVIPVINGLRTMMYDNENFKGLKQPNLKDYTNMYIDNVVFKKSDTIMDTIPVVNVKIGPTVNMLQSFLGAYILAGNIGVGVASALNNAISAYTEGIATSLANALGIEDGMPNATHIIKASGLFFKDMGKIGAIMEKYQLADMSMENMTNHFRRLKTGKTMFNEHIAHWTNWATDYYARSIMVVAKMIKDGSYDAHVFDSNTGEIVYDIKKDKRFYSNSKITNEGGVLLDAMKNQASYEGQVLMNDKGELLSGYTLKQAEYLKMLADKYVVGAYSAEVRSMLGSSFVGRMAGMFRSYLSSKIANAFSSGHYIDKGGQFILQKDADGNVTARWERLFVEGWAVTTISAITHLVTLGNMKGEYAWSKMNAQQKKNVLRTASLVSLSLLTYGAYNLLKGLRDDDEDKIKKNIKLQYILKDAYVNVFIVSTLWETLQTPFTALSMIKRLFTLNFKSDSPDGITFEIIMRALGGVGSSFKDINETINYFNK